MILGLNEFKKCISWPIFGLVKISVGSNRTPLTTWSCKTITVLY